MTICLGDSSIGVKAIGERTDILTRLIGIFSGVFTLDLLSYVNLFKSSFVERVTRFFTFICLIH